MTGVELRLGQLFDRESRRSFIVALDHGLTLGVPKGAEEMLPTLDRCLPGQPDGIVLSPGMARLAAGSFAHRGAPALLVRSDFIIGFPVRSDLGEHYRVLVSPAEVAALGGSAVVMFLLFGATNGALIADNAAAVAHAAREAHRHGLPLIAEVVLWGNRIANQRDPERLAFGCRVSSELGADAIKTEFTGDAETMRQVIAGCGRPVLVLGGAKGDEAALIESTRTAIRSGASGVIIGRNVWQSSDPAGISRRLREVVHAASV